MNNYMKLMGLKCKDMVTGFEGIVSSISFDLYGCVMVVLTPIVGKDGKKEDGHWFDAKRIKVLGNKPVMAVPDFRVAPGVERGPAEKPSICTRA